MSFIDMFGGMPMGGYAPQAASTQPSFWGGAMDKLGGLVDRAGTSTWLKDPNNLAMMLGGMGKAVTAGHPESWQSQVSGLASGMGQSGKIAAAGAKISKQQSDLNDAIAALGGGMTPAGMRGMNKFTSDNKGGFTFSGDYGADSNQGPFSINQGLEPSTMAPQETDTRALQNFNQGSTGLTADDLLGLSSQEVNALLTQQLAGGRQGLDVAKTAYEMGKPAAEKAGKVVEGRDFYYTVGANGEVVKTDIPTPRKVTSAKSSTVKYWDASGKYHEVTTQDPNTVRSTIEDSGGSLSDPSDVSGREKQDESMARRHVSAINAITDDHVSSEAQTAVDEVNRTAPDNASSVYVWVPRTAMTRASKEGAQKIKLPKINGRQITVKDIKRSLEGMPGKTFQDAVMKVIAMSMNVPDVKPTGNPDVMYDLGQGSM